MTRIPQLYPRSGLTLLGFMRWLFVVPAGYAGFAFALFVYFVLATTLEIFCPEADRTYTGCQAPWYLFAKSVLYFLCAGFAGACVVLSCTFLAPSHKVGVARIAYAAGFLYAVRWAVDVGFWREALCAAAFGAFTLARIERWGRLRAHPNASANHGSPGSQRG